ncbi:MAG: DUF3253 domain-containing protein [Bacteroidota bacterium]
MKRKEILSCMIELLEKRGECSSICPSEVARACFPEDWREYMEEVREVAKELANEGRASILQKGEVLQEDNWKGPIRIRIKHS